MRLLRKKEARARLGMGKTNFHETYIKTGRLRSCRSANASNASLRRTLTP